MPFFKEQKKNKNLKREEYQSDGDICFDYSEGVDGERYLALFPPDNQHALRWLAALSAQNIPYRLVENPRGWVISVGTPESEAALHEIREYERVNRNWPRARYRGVEDIGHSETDRQNAIWTSSIGVTILVFWYAWTGPAEVSPELVERGAASATAIRDGEVWRCITALTLHADFGHIFGNVVSLFFFGYFVCRKIGAGFGWLLVLIAGGAGNLVNAWLTPAQHVSLGASTAGFAALGMVSFFQFCDKYRELPDLRTIWHRAWVVLAAAVALLALLGTGPGSDVTGHLAGFGAGVLAGIVSYKMVMPYRHRILPNAIAYGIFWAVLLAAWRLAQASQF